MDFFKRFLCLLFGHQYGRLTNNMINLPHGGEFCGCKRCRKLFVINREIRFLFDWADIRDAFGLSHNPFVNKGCGTCASYQDAGFGILDCDTCDTDAQQNWKPCRSYLIERVKILAEGLSSISKNTCCDKCREAALVASDTLSRAACAQPSLFTGGQDLSEPIQGR